MNSRLNRLVWIFAALGLMMGGIYSSAWGQTANIPWSQPQSLGDGWWQSVAVDRQGTAYVGWYDVTGEWDALNYSSRTLNGEWTPANEVVVTGEGGYTVRNALAVTSDGMLHAVFRAGTFHRFSSALAALATSATNWDPGVRISSTGYYVDMVVDHNDALHIIYSGRESDGTTETVSLEADPCAFCQDLYYRRSVDGGATWSLPRNLTRDPTTGSDRMDIREGASGRLYIVWDEGLDWSVGRGSARDVRFVYSDNGGLTWSDPIILVGDGEIDARPIQIALTELRNGVLLAVWRYSNDLNPFIYYQLSDDLGETWTEPQPIPGIVARSINDTPLDDYELVTDSLGTAHLFAVGQAEENDIVNPTLYHMEFRQGQWRSRQSVFYSPADQPEWPKAAIGPQGDIHLTWFVRRRAEGVVNSASTEGLRVFYSYRGPILPNYPTGEFNPTHTPLPTATAFQRLIPTVTPFPTVAPIAQPAVSMTRDTYATQVLLGGLFTVMIVCGGVFIGVRLRGRR